MAVPGTLCIAVATMPAAQRAMEVKPHTIEIGKNPKTTMHINSTPGHYIFHCQHGLQHSSWLQQLYKDDNEDDVAKDGAHAPRYM